MVPESYLSAFTAYLALGLVAYSLVRRPRSAIPFALVGLSVLLWESGFAFVAQATNEAEAWAGYRWGAWGFCFTGWATMVFLLQEAGWTWRKTLLWSAPVLLAGLVFALQSTFGVLYVEGFELQPGRAAGYRMATSSPWFWAFNLNYVGHVISIVVLVAVSRRQSLRRVRLRGYSMVGLYLGAVVLHVVQSSWGPMTGTVLIVHPVIPVNALLLVGVFAVVSWTEPRSIDAPWIEAKVLDAVHDGIAVFDLSGRLVRANPAWESLAPDPGQWEVRPLVDGDELVGTVGHIRREGAVDSAAHRYGLTLREEQVAIHVLAGQTNKEIAQALDLGEASVKAHLSQIFAKTGATDREELFRWLL